MFGTLLAPGMLGVEYPVTLPFTLACFQSLPFFDKDLKRHPY